MKRITVFFRYDDYSETSSAVADAGLISVLRRQAVPCTFAVIPAVTAGNFRDPDVTENRPLGAEKLGLLRSAIRDGVVDVSLHGLHHRTRFRNGPHSEFIGLDRARQADMIRQGKQALEQQLGVPVRGFVPPWNNYDANTLAALEDSAIAGLSANRYSPCLDREGIRYLPITIETHELRAAIARARASSELDPIIGVLLHPYDFKESGDSRARMTCAEFEKEVEWLKAQGDVLIQSVTQLVAGNPTLDTERFQANQPARWENLFPPFVARTADGPLYLSAGAARASRQWRTGITILFHVAVLICGFIAANAAQAFFSADLNGTTATVLRAAVWGAVAVLGVRTVIRQQLYFRALAVWLGLTGVGLALIQ